MDYRITTILGSARKQLDAANASASELRGGTTGAREVSSYTENQIASYNGQAAAYRWIVTQLEALDLPGAGEQIGSHGLYCEPCAGHVAALKRAWDALAQEYGWSMRYDDRVGKVNSEVTALVEATDGHKRGR